MVFSIQSRDIAEYALRTTPDGETKALLDLHYGYPIEELTFGGDSCPQSAGADQ